MKPRTSDIRGRKQIAAWRRKIANRCKKRAERNCSSSSCHTIIACMIAWIHIFPSWKMQFLPIDTTIANAFDHFNRCWVSVQFLRTWFQTILVCLHVTVKWEWVPLPNGNSGKCVAHETLEANGSATTLRLIRRKWNDCSEQKCDKTSVQSCLDNV